MKKIAYILLTVIIFNMTAICAYANEQINVKNLNNNFIFIEPQFDKIEVSNNPNESLIGCGKNGKFGFIDKTGKVVIPFVYEDVYAFSEGLACVKKNGKYGFIDRKGKLVIDYQFDKYSLFRSPSPFEGGIALVFKNKKYGFIDKTGKYVIEPAFDDCNSLLNQEGVAAVCQNGKWGFIDRKGNFIVEPQFEDCSGSCEMVHVNDADPSAHPFITDMTSFVNGISIVNKDGKSYYVDNSGKRIPTQDSYELGEFIMPDAAQVIKDGKIGLIDRTGKTLVEPKFEAMTMGKKLSVVRMGGKWGIIDRTGKFIIEPYYDNSVVKMGSMWGITNRTGDGIAKFCDKSSCEFDNINGMFPVQKDGKWGLIDENGRQVVPLLSDEVPIYFYDGAILVKENGKWVFADESGKRISEAEYEDIDFVSDNINLLSSDRIFLAVKKDGVWGLIDKSANYLIKPQFKEFGYNNLSIYFQGENKTGDLQYDSITIPYSNSRDNNTLGNVGIINTKGKNELININGKVILPPQIRSEINPLGGGIYEIDGINKTLGKSGFLIDKSYVKENRIVLDGANLNLDVPPVIVDGRTLVPARAIFEKLGASVDWYNDSKTVKVSRGQDISIELQIDSKTAKVNGKEIMLDVPAKILEGRTLVPLRFVSESLGAKVEWDDDLKTVFILSNSLEVMSSPNLTKDSISTDNFKIKLNPTYLESKELIRLSVEFENIGDTPINIDFSKDFKLRDSQNKLLGCISNEKQTIGPGQTKSLNPQFEYKCEGITIKVNLNFIYKPSISEYSIPITELRLPSVN